MRPGRDDGVWTMQDQADEEVWTRAAPGQGRRSHNSRLSVSIRSLPLPLPALEDHNLNTSIHLGVPVEDMERSNKRR